MRLATFISPGADFGAAVDLVRRAESAGYESAWVTHGLGRDSFLVLAAYGQATSRIGLGNGVVPIYPRHPVVMAQAALTLNEQVRGRFTLGIGVSHRASMDAMLGVPIKEPLAVMREYVAVLRGALGAGADFEGKHYRAHWSLAVPTRPPAPPIYLAALGPKMCELAGEIADGAILWLTSPDYVRDVARPAIERGRRRAGKTLQGFEVVAAVPLAVTDDRTAAVAARRRRRAAALRGAGRPHGGRHRGHVIVHHVRRADPSTAAHPLPGHARGEPRRRRRHLGRRRREPARPGREARPAARDPLD